MVKDSLCFLKHENLVPFLFIYKWHQWPFMDLTRKSKREMAGNYSCVMTACKSCHPKPLLFSLILLHILSLMYISFEFEVYLYILVFCSVRPTTAKNSKNRNHADNYTQKILYKRNDNNTLSLNIPRGFSIS